MSDTNKTTTTTASKSRAKAKAAEPTQAELLAQLRDEYSKLKDLPLKRQALLAQRNQQTMAKYYAKEKRVPVRVAPLYDAYFGRVMLIKLNGIPIYVPCDNNVYEIPESYAMEVMGRIRKVDDQGKRQKRLSDYKANFDGNRVGGVDLVTAL